MLGEELYPSSDQSRPVYARYSNNEHPGEWRVNPIMTIPSAGDLGSIFLGIPHQKSIYMVLLSNALPNKQYDYKLLFHIVYSRINLS